MPDLIVIFGPPASGKAAIGSELARLTGFRFFHNHMTAEPVAALFGWGAPLGGEIKAELRLWLLSKAIEFADQSNIIFTFVWALQLSSDDNLIAQLGQIFGRSGGKVHFVELLASLEVRKARDGTSRRLNLKPSKRNIERSISFQPEIEGKFNLNSCGEFAYSKEHLVIDTEKQNETEAAQLICKHFGFNKK
jgi:hypothetical protein